MSGHVNRTVAAKTDLIEHYEYIARDNTSAAERFLLASERTLQTLANLPRLGQVWPSPDPRLTNLRFWPVPHFEKYLIFYRQTNNSILVVRVLHSARDIPSLLL